MKQDRRSACFPQRRIERQRLPHCKATADAGFWNQHWQTHLSPEIRKRAEQGNLGPFEQSVASYLPQKSQQPFLTGEAEEQVAEEVVTRRFRTAGEIRDWIAEQ